MKSITEVLDDYKSMHFNKPNMTATLCRYSFDHMGCNLRDWGKELEERITPIAITKRKALSYT
jgi:hypothetical protein